MEVIITFIVGVMLIGLVAYGVFLRYRKILREAKNYERGLKMVPLKIYLPPSSDDIESNGRDSRDVAEEAISQAQVMYNIISSTATKGFKSSVYGQRHIAFEIIATKGVIHYYVAVPLVLEDVVRQALTAAYPTVRLEQSEEINIFSKVGKSSGTIGGEFSLKKSFARPIATFQETKRDAMQSILNALSTLSHDDGAAIQILLRPAHDSWTKTATSEAGDLRKGKKKAKGLSNVKLGSFAEALWKAPESDKEKKPEDKQINSVEQAMVEAIEEKTRHPGYETLIRVITSSNTSARSQALLKNIVTSFSLYEASGRNGFKFTTTKNVEAFTTSFIFRFFPQNINRSILNTVELATIFHLPDQKHTQTSQLQRQASKQVDGPYQTLDDGFLMGYNVFRGVKKQIRLGTVDRRRHTYIIGQTGTGKSGLLENLALQDMLDGKGFAFVDPHGDSAEKLLGMVPKERVEDVIYFSPGDMEFPVGLNLFEFDTKEQRDFLVQEAIAMLYRLYDPGHTGIIGPRYEHWFRNAALTIMSDPNGSSFIDIPQVFNDDDFAKAKLKYVTDQTVLDFWNKEMAQTSDYHKSEVLGWFVSKFGAFLSNEMMRNIIGQTKSGFNLRDIMDNKKILLVNLSKGMTGELNSQLLGMIFIMKFQAAAMGRANIPEDEREDFALYVDEFQNFATDSFESILSEARKYRLNLILANQFMTQLTDKIREAIIGNVGTIISGRIGITDAELMVKKFAPVFDAEDITKLPNFETIASVMINNVPSSPFSMSLVPPLGKSNPQLKDALKRLSAAKFGRPRAVVQEEIFKRLRAGEEEKKLKQKNALESFSERMKQKGSSSQKSAAPSEGAVLPGASGGSFLDEWLAKRKTAPPNPGVGAPPLQSAPVQKQPAPQSPPQPAPSPLPLNSAPQVSTQATYVSSRPQIQQQDTTPIKGMQQTQNSIKNDAFTGVNYNHQPAAAAPKLEDANSIEESIMETQHQAEKRQSAEHHELQIQPKKGDQSSDQSAEDDVREVTIDLRGNLQYIDNTKK